LAPEGFTAQNLRLTLSAAPASGKGYTLLVNKTDVDTTLKVPLSGVQSGSDVTHRVHFAQGDYFCYHFTEQGSPTALYYSAVVDIVPDTPGHVFLFGQFNSAAGALAYIPLTYATGTSNTESNTYFPMPGTATVIGIAAQVQSACTGSAYWKMMVRKNSGDTSLFVNLNAGVTTLQTASGSVGFTAGQLINIAAEVPAGSCVVTTGGISLVLTMPTMGQFIVGSVRNSNVVNNDYAWVTGRVTGGSNWNGTESFVQQITDGFQVTAAALQATTAPGGTAYYDFYLRNQPPGGSASNVLDLHLSGSNTTATATPTSPPLNMYIGGLMSIQAVPSGSPTNPGQTEWGFLCYVPPSDSHFLEVMR
jgi:hypothetical protein